jgi:hypothetical protein
VALAATMTGGVALAAGSVSWSQDPADHRPVSASATPSGPAGGSNASRGPSGSPAATPHPSAVGLCRAYTAGAGSAPGKALENPAFTSLIKAAGGKDKVPGYCAAVLAADSKRAKRAQRSNQPNSSGKGKAGHPSALPTPSDQPHGKANPQHTGAAYARP